MSIYTRRGDRGETSLADGSRCRKDSARVEAYGALDEANSAIGLARSAGADAPVEDVLRFAQQRLFNCTAMLARPADSVPAGSPSVTAEDVAALETSIDRFEALSGPPAGFVVEGGCEVAARLHVARAIVRRAERRVVTLDTLEPVDENVMAFVNRLSDALFAAARYSNTVAGHLDEAWNAQAPRPCDGSSR